MIHSRHLVAIALLCWSFVSLQAIAQEKDTVVAPPSAFLRYPAAAKQAGLEGNVTVRVFINEQGDYVKHEVIESTDAIFTQAVEEVLPHLDLPPAMSGGRPLKTWITLPFEFSLDDKDSLAALPAAKYNLVVRNLEVVPQNVEGRQSPKHSSPPQAIHLERAKQRLEKEIWVSAPTQVSAVYQLDLDREGKVTNVSTPLPPALEEAASANMLRIIKSIQWEPALAGSKGVECTVQLKIEMAEE